jgi:hypothetical protein
MSTLCGGRHARRATVADAEPRGECAELVVDHARIGSIRWPALTFRQPFGANVGAFDGPCDRGNPGPAASESVAGGLPGAEGGPRRADAAAHGRRSRAGPGKSPATAREAGESIRAPGSGQPRPGSMRGVPADLCAMVRSALSESMRGVPADLGATVPVSAVGGQCAASRRSHLCAMVSSTPAGLDAMRRGGTISAPGFRSAPSALNARRPSRGRGRCRPPAAPPDGRPAP